MGTGILPSITVSTCSVLCLRARAVSVLARGHEEHRVLPQER
jgi:hypothetical protein